ncbi:hypothetical protein GCM10009677_43580 [Sphaerisporangium rubeum]
MCYGLDNAGLPRHITQIVLQDVIATWVVTPTTPGNISNLLRKSRIAVLCSLVGRELLSDGVLSSLHAVEAALRQRIVDSGASGVDRRGAPLAWNNLFQRAVSLGLLNREPDEADRDLIDYGRELRNSLSHPSAVLYLTYAAALPLMETSHRVVSRLYPPVAEDKPGGAGEPQALVFRRGATGSDTATDHTEAHN